MRFSLPNTEGELMAPFKSESQRRKFAELVKQGKMDPRVFDLWNKETGKRKLPEKVQKPVKVKIIK